MRNLREFETLLLRELIKNHFITTEHRANLIKEQTIKKTPILNSLMKDSLITDEFINDFIATNFKARILQEDEDIKPTHNTTTDELFSEYKVIIEYVDETSAKAYFFHPIFNAQWDDIYERLDRNIERIVIHHDLFLSMNTTIEDGKKMRKYFAISSSKDLQNLEESQRAIKFVDEVLNKCIKLNASDIHIEPQKNNFRIRMRLNGVLQVFGEYEEDFFPSFSSRMKLISNLNIAEKRDTQDGALVYQYKKEDTEEVYDIPFRVSVMPIIYGEKIVLRKLGNQDVTINLSNLGMSENLLNSWKDIISKPHGIILVSGPTGSGKSTTLQAAINQIKSDEINITTVEDPVEAKISGINQVQIDSFKVSFADALRSILRQDPDIVMIGEIRDKETAEISLRASLTGHLVFSTIHTNDAPSSVTRLVDMGIEPFLVSSSVVAVLAQRLVRVLCDECKKEDMTTQTEMQSLMINEQQKIYRPCGCFKCANTGYTSRVGVYELMIVDTHIQKMINDKKSDVEIKEYAINTLKMPTIFTETKKKVLEGITSISEFKKVVAE